MRETPITKGDNSFTNKNLSYCLQRPRDVKTCQRLLTFDVSRIWLTRWLHHCQMTT